MTREHGNRVFYIATRGVSRESPKVITENDDQGMSTLRQVTQPSTFSNSEMSTTVTS